MSIMKQKAHELGELIKNSVEMKALEQADEAQKNDPEAQKLLAEYNLKRMNIARDLQEGKIKQAEGLVKNNEAFFQLVEGSKAIENYVEAKKEFDSMVNEINKILNYYITGEDPECTHDCSTCGGCH